MKHIPLRTCIVCRKKKAKYLLDRYVYIRGEFILDREQKLPGRGFYICREENCRQKAGKRFSSLKYRLSKLGSAWREERS
ncbi:hypothetical protein JCM13304A_17930 [Desulfothermus okinawensis JCM 13304]